MENLENKNLGIELGIIIHHLDVLLQKAALRAERQANSKNPIFLAKHSIKEHLKHLAERENRANENTWAIDLDEGLPETGTYLGQSSLFKKQSTNPHQCRHSVEI